MKKIQHAKNIIPKNIRIGETCFTVFSITGGSIDKTHMNCDQFFLIYMIITNKLNSYGGDVKLHLCEDDQQEVHTIP